jgi:hypothetical protein
MAKGFSNPKDHDPNKNMQRIPEFTIQSSTVIVSMDKMKSYYRDEVANEGSFRKDVPQLILSPSSGLKEANKQWLFNIFTQMEKARLNNPPKLIDFNSELQVDAGLIDIQIVFKGPQQSLMMLMKESPNLLLEKHLEHLDLISQGAFHDQMTLVSALHCVDPNGDLCFHHHNIIFGLRKENNLIGILDFEEFLSNLNKYTKIGLVV